MGQVQSDVAAVDQGKQGASVRNNPHPTSMEALLAEATAFGDDENESLDAKAQKALECPCVDGLRKGPCGGQFSEAFVCFLKSTAEEKIGALEGEKGWFCHDFQMLSSFLHKEQMHMDWGIMTRCSASQTIKSILLRQKMLEHGYLEGSDCVHPFVALQNCIKANPDAFPKEVLDEDGNNKEQEYTDEYKIIPPNWSQEPKRRLK